jgi:glycerol-3-phosphate cytidylyltransferase-like family protein
VIVATDRLEELHGRVTMVDGGFDPLHPGHVRYFAAAAALGLPVLCNVSGDDWVSRKHPPLLTQAQRVELIDAFRDVGHVHASAVPSAQVLELARPRFYAKGVDWEGRLPEEELRVCERHGIEVVYLDTVVDSSTEILRRFGATR